MHIERGFNLQTERYAFDFKHCTFSNGYTQLDTYQDASYFGVWANPVERKIVCYAEGDITISTADDDREFTQAVRDEAFFHDKHGEFIGIDTGLDHHNLEQRFIDLGLGGLLSGERRRTRNKRRRSLLGRTRLRVEDQYSDPPENWLSPKRKAEADKVIARYEQMINDHMKPTSYIRGISKLLETYL